MVGRVIHIFGGIPTVKFGMRRKPENNLAALQKDFRRFGIRIGPNCRIANSTLENLVQTINATVKPFSSVLREIDQELLEAFDPNWAPDPSEEDKMPLTRDAFNEMFEALNFNISIGAGVIIGEDVMLSPAIEIGAGTRIGDRTRVHPGTIIGRNCIIGKAVDFSEGCTIGDNTAIADRTTFEDNFKVPANSLVEHESPDSTMAKVRNRLELV